MAGHSKWANIQHRKGRVDAARGKLWSKLSKKIIIAAKTGGGDPDANFTLRKAIDDAKAVSMPKDNIQRAIKSGTGELGGGSLEEWIYEGYGPGGVAVMCESLTDNRNRTGPEIKTIFKKCGGDVGKTGCVSYLFDRKGVFVFDAQSVDEEALTMLALEHGGDDVERNEDKFQVTSPVEAFNDLSDAFEKAEMEPERSELEWLPQTMLDLDGPTAGKVLRLLAQLDDHDDIQSVSTNLNITDEAIAESEG